jgi:hypothetical protein
MSLSFSANSVRSFVRQFERPGAMRGEQVRLKDALDRPQAHARRLRQHPARPMGHRAASRRLGARSTAGRVLGLLWAI